MSGTVSDMAFRLMSLDYSGHILSLLGQANRLDGADQAMLAQLLTKAYRDGFVSALVLQDGKVDVSAVSRMRLNGDALLDNLARYDQAVTHHASKS